MYIDFHTHAKLAKMLPFSTQYTDWLLSTAKNAGLDALCLTEHFNTWQFSELYRYVALSSVREGDTLVFNGLRIFPGMEIDIAEGGHMLAIGILEDMLDLNMRLEPYKGKDSFPPFVKLIDLLEEYPILVGAAHPFREGGHIPELPYDQLCRLDFLDLNGKDMAEHPERTRQMTYALGKTLGKPVLSGSDTHQATQYGCIRTCFEKECTTVAALREQIQGEHYQIEMHPDAAFRVKTAGLVKRALKTVHALGGDYVALLLEDTELYPFEYPELCPPPILQK